MPKIRRSLHAPAYLTHLVLRRTIYAVYAHLSISSVLSTFAHHYSAYTIGCTALLYTALCQYLQRFTRLYDRYYLHTNIRNRIIRRMIRYYRIALYSAYTRLSAAHIRRKLSPARIRACAYNSVLFRALPLDRALYRA